MGWLVVAGILALAVFSPGFRVVLAVVVSVVGLAGFAYYEWNRAEESASRRRVPQGDVVLEDLRLGSSSSSYRLSGRLRNRNPKYTITWITVDVTLRDCEPAERPDVCDIVGEEKTTVFLDVPPGQVRAIDSGVYFSSGTVVRNQMQWSYRLTEVRAR